MRGYIRPGNFVRKASLGKLAEACLGRMCLVGPIDARIQRTLRANVDGIPEVMFELLECRIGGEQHVPYDPRSPVCPLANIERRFEPRSDYACRQTTWLGKVVSMREQDAERFENAQRVSAFVQRSSPRGRQ